MRLLDINWVDFFRGLPAWERLPPPARNVLLQVVRPSQPAHKSWLGGQFDILAKAGIFAETASESVTVQKEYQPFCRVVRALGRNRVHDAASPQAFYQYIGEYFTLEERQALTNKQYRYDGGQWLYKRVSSSDWLEEFLAATETSWEAAYQADKRTTPYLYSSHVLRATQALLRRLMEQPGAVLFRDLQQTCPELDTDLLAAAIRAGIRYLFFFPSLRSEDLEPVLGIWPVLRRRLRRSAATPPEPVAVKEVFHSAFLMDDMTAILVACAADPLRLRGNDRRLFARAQRDIESNLVDIPGWAQETFRVGAPARIHAALSFLFDSKFLQQNDLRLEATEAGLQWMALSAKQRLKVLLDRVRGAASGPFLAYPVAIPAWFKHRPDVVRLVRNVFGGLGLGSFVRVADFLHYHRENENPFLPFLKEKYSYLQIGRMYLNAPLEEELEEAWMHVLNDFLCQRLLPLGGAKVALGEDRIVCFSISDAGRYVLGLGSDFEFGHAAEGGVVVQPNFEIVFLAPSPPAEAEIARFAERKGRQVGVLFRITKKSILGAAAAGLTAQQVLEALRQASSRELPSNVEHEIRGWLSRCRRITIRPAVVIQCPDPDTAARVRAAAGGKVKAITDTLLELEGFGEQKALARKLREMGIFS